MTETVKMECGHTREAEPLVAEAARFWGYIFCPSCMAVSNLEAES